MSDFLGAEEHVNHGVIIGKELRGEGAFSASDASGSIYCVLLIRSVSARSLVPSPLMYDLPFHFQARA